MVTIYIYGYKLADDLPEMDFTLDCRFISNPYYDGSLRHLTGLDQAVIDSVVRDGGIELQNIIEDAALDAECYDTECTHDVNVGVFCTRGRHRSVVVGNLLKSRLTSRGISVKVVYVNPVVAEKARGRD
jgi:RNase adapter protein RapZ